MKGSDLMSVKVYKDGKLQQVAGNADTRLIKDDVISILGYTPADSSKIGVSEGFATLDSNGKLSESQKPIYGWSEINNIPSIMDAAKTSLVCTGNSASATQLETSRVLMIGNTGKSFNGTSDVSWTLDEMGVAPASHTHNYAGSSSVGGAAITALECTGNSATATKATQDGSGNVISDTYATKTEIIANNDTISSYEVGKSGTGWYRIAKFASNSYESKGSTANSCQLFIKRVYGNNNNEYHEVKLSSVYGKSKLVSGANLSNEQYITNIRHTVDTVSNVAYIEIYYTSTEPDLVTLIINNGRCVYNKYWECIEPEFTEETVDDVIVYSKLNIPANATSELKADLKEYDVPLTDDSYGDFNNYLDIGIYVFGKNVGMANTSNAPTNKAGTLIVTDYTGGSKSMSETYAYRVQEFHTHDNSGVYKRNIQTGGVAELIVGEWVETISGTSAIVTKFTNHMNNKNKPHIYSFGDTTAYTKKVIGLIKLNTWDYCGGTIELFRTNGVVRNSKIEFSIQKKYNTTSEFMCDYKASGFTELSPVIFTYNGEIYAGFYFFNSVAHQENVRCDTYSYTGMKPFLVDVRNASTGAIVNEEIYNSLQYDAYTAGYVVGAGTWDIKAVKDGNGNNIVDTYATKTALQALESRIAALENK